MGVRESKTLKAIAEVGVSSLQVKGGAIESCSKFS